MRSLRIFFYLSSFLVISSLAAQESIGNYTADFQQDRNKYVFSFDSADLALEFCSPAMVRIRTSWSGQFDAPEEYMVVQYDWPEVNVAMEEQNDAIWLVTDQLKIVVSKAPFTITIYDQNGKTLTSGIQGFSNGKKVSAKARMSSNEHFFGFGERMDFLDQRGKTVELNVGRGEARPHIIGAYNVLEANYCPVPFFMSTQGYGIFLHTPYASTWDMGSTSDDSYSFTATGGELDYYFIYGPQFSEILNSYTDLTGKSPLMNRFAFGLHVGSYSGGTWGHEHLTSTQYVVALARKFRELGIPIDILHLDSTWRIFGENGGKGATSFEWRETFDDPEAMFDSIYDMNYNMVGVHLRPRFDNGKTLRLLDSARAKGYVYPEDNNPGEFVNFFDEEAVDWWWDEGVMRVASQGAMFLKTDEGSAFGRKANESDKMGPQGAEIQRLHNIFPLVYAKAPYTKFQEYNGIRGMNHTREGYAGIQRYPFIFAGDWPSEWQYFEPVIKAGLNIGISGVGYWAHCMGGFEHPADPELYIRWCQFGLMSPVAHLFGMDHPGYKEPWNYGEEGVKIFRQYDQMRYRLIPYMYSKAWEMYNTGMPLMRALVLENQEDINTYNITDQYLLGDAILIAPVTTKGAQTRTLYLPEGTWYSHWDGKTYEGKNYIHVVTPLDQMPIFYKGGSIIPTQPDVQYIDSKPWETLTLDIYPGPDASFNLYEDDGKSLEYQDGVYAVTKISAGKSDKLKVTIGPSEGKFKVPSRKYILKVHLNEKPSAISARVGKKSEKMKAVSVAGNSSEWSYDPQSGILTVVLNKGQEENIEVGIQ